MTLIRLNKYIANKGYCSRRKADELIADGKVKINGKIINELGVKVGEQDNIKIEGNILNQFLNNNIKKIYIALNKPTGYISSATSKQGKSVLELIPEKFGRLYPIGRLDKNSEGLIILTNDGELTNTITHPKFKHEKEYEVVINKIIDNKSIKKLESGFLVDGEFMKIKSVKVYKSKSESINLNLILTEGKKRQIRLMLKNLGFEVLKLKRIRINKLKLENLKTGKWKEIKKHQII